jgi:hypothetical protein
MSEPARRPVERDRLVAALARYAEDLHRRYPDGRRSGGMTHDNWLYIDKPDMTRHTSPLQSPRGVRTKGPDGITSSIARQVSGAR